MKIMSFFYTIMKLEKKPMKNSLIKKYEKATELNDRGTKMRLITEEEMTETVKKYEVKENLFILKSIRFYKCQDILFHLQYRKVM